MIRPIAPALAVALLLMTPPPASAQDQPDPDKVIDALEQASGVHHGLRRNHAKGSCAVGQFVGAKEARRYSASALFGGGKIPVVARFSLAGPNPAVPDATPSPRGMALQFQLPGGELQQMAMLNVPVFPVASVEAFYQLLQIDLPDPVSGKKDPSRAPAFFAAHPEAKPMIDWLHAHNAAPSYGRMGFNSLHAFKMVAADHSAHWVRWRFQPKAGEAFLTEDEVKAAAADFLDRDLAERTRKGTLQWDMIVTLGEAGDPIDNPSAAWPAGRKSFTAGTLTLTKGAAAAAGSCEDINFDPNLVAAGIETSPDPILQYRSLAYAVSYGRRMGEKP